GPGYGQPMQGPPPGYAQGYAQGGQPQQVFSSEQLDAMMAPVALYPDQLLTMTLMASTYPQQLMEANHWLQQDGHRQLQGQALEAAMHQMPWDPSVKSLVQFPQVIDGFVQHPDWAQQVGYAMSVQQNDVFNSVQRLRARAAANGQLASNQQITVRTEPLPPIPAGAPPPPPDMPQQIIIIEAANPNVVYAPFVDPSVYG